MVVGPGAAVVGVVDGPVVTVVAVVVGGVVPAQDHEALHGLGVAAIFGPGTVIPDAAASLLDRLQ